MYYKKLLAITSEYDKNCGKCHKFIPKGTIQYHDSYDNQNYCRECFEKYKKIDISLVILWVLIIVAWIGMILIPGGSESSSKTKTCGSCGRSFTVGEKDYSGHNNARCIQMTGMCWNCYNNYCYAKNIHPDNY